MMCMVCVFCSSTPACRRSVLCGASPLGVAPHSVAASPLGARDGRGEVGVGWRATVIVSLTGGAPIQTELEQRGFL